MVTAVTCRLVLEALPLAICYPSACCLTACRYCLPLNHLSSCILQSCGYRIAALPFVTLQLASLSPATTDLLAAAFQLPACSLSQCCLLPSCLLPCRLPIAPCLYWLSPLCLSHYCYLLVALCIVVLVLTAVLPRPLPIVTLLLLQYQILPLVNAATCRLAALPVPLAACVLLVVVLPFAAL